MYVRIDFDGDSFCGHGYTKLQDNKCGENVYYMIDEINEYLFMYGSGTTYGYDWERIRFR